MPILLENNSSHLALQRSEGDNDDPEDIENASNNRPHTINTHLSHRSSSHNLNGRRSAAAHVAANPVSSACFTLLGRSGPRQR